MASYELSDEEWTAEIEASFTEVSSYQFVTETCDGQFMPGSASAPSPA